MAEIPNLAGVATAELVEKISAGNFAASYINWSRTMHLLRVHAPGWLPELMRNPDGGLIHKASLGGFLLIRFKHVDGSTTPEVPQAIMDSRNNSISGDKITSRDVTDTHRRGVCMAAALTFGLAYELWAKMPLETGYAEEDKPQELSDEEKRKIAHDETLEANRETVEAIQAALEVDDLYTASEAWRELSKEEMRALWIAPSKGGIFTTEQRRKMRLPEFTKKEEE